LKLWTTSANKLLTATTLVYNKLDFVQACVESMIRFGMVNHDDMDYVLWDQGAPYPGVAEYLKEINEETGDWLQVQGGGFNIGVGAALNNIIENMDSQFFFKLDDDCELTPLVLPMMIIAYSLAERSGFPLGVLSADVIGVGKGDTKPEDEVEVMPGLFFQPAWCVGGGAVLISRKVLEEVGPFRADRLYGVEDGDFAGRAMRKGLYNCYLKSVYYISHCRQPEADPLIDAWKLDYFQHETDLAFDAWRKAQAFEGKLTVDT